MLNFYRSRQVNSSKQRWLLVPNIFPLLKPNSAFRGHETNNPPILRRHVLRESIMRETPPHKLQLSTSEDSNIPKRYEK